MSVSFNGTTFPLAHTEVGAMPGRDKVVEFAGADGCEVLSLGRGVRDIVVRGVSTGVPSRTTLEGLRDDRKYTLSVDGDSYGSCRCVDVGPFTSVQTTDGKRTYFTIRFRQETPD